MQTNGDTFSIFTKDRRSFEHRHLPGLFVQSFFFVNTGHIWICKARAFSFLLTRLSYKRGLSWIKFHLVFSLFRYTHCRIDGWIWSLCVFRHCILHPTLFPTFVFPKHAGYQCLWIFWDIRRPGPLVLRSQAVHAWRPDTGDRGKAEMETRQKTTLYRHYITTP